MPRDIRRMREIERQKIDILDGASSRLVKQMAGALQRLNGRVGFLLAELEQGTLVKTDALRLARALATRTQVEEILLEVGYRDSVNSLMKAYDRVATLSLDGLAAAGMDARFTQADVRALTAVKDLDLSRWSRLGADIADDVHKLIVESVIVGDSMKTTALAIESLLAGIGEKESRIIPRARTMANTFIGAFDRTVTARKAAQTKTTTFVYLGPDDKTTRPFCQALLEGTASAQFNIPEPAGTVDGESYYTLEQISAMDNGQGLPVLQFGGGYNCRHALRPIAVTEEAQVA